METESTDEVQAEGDPQLPSAPDPPPPPPPYPGEISTAEGTDHLAADTDRSPESGNEAGGAGPQQTQRRNSLSQLASMVAGGLSAETGTAPPEEAPKMSIRDVVKEQESEKLRACWGGGAHRCPVGLAPLRGRGGNRGQAAGDGAGWRWGGRGGGLTLGRVCTVLARRRRCACVQVVRARLGGEDERVRSALLLAEVRKRSCAGQHRPPLGGRMSESLSRSVWLAYRGRALPREPSSHYRVFHSPPLPLALQERRSPQHHTSSSCHLVNA